MEKRENNFTETMKKSVLQAKDQYDFHRLEAAGDHFLPMTWQETQEEVTFTYDTRRVKPLTGLRREEKSVILNLLMQAGKFEGDAGFYHFSMSPENLYYNTEGSVYIKSRDILSGREAETALYIKEYKALTAWALTGQYAYEDYLEGGEELLGKHSATRALLPIGDARGMIGYLEETKSKYLQRQQERTVRVGRTGNRFLKAMAAVLLIGVIALGAYSGLQYFRNIPYLTAVNAANDAYIVNDSVALIDALKEIPPEEMGKPQKYILAKAYIQGENLTSEQKDNLTGKMTPDTNDRELEYWIHLGRMEVKEAENMAMQLSDDELLLYAYMKEKDQVESDTDLAGRKKRVGWRRSSPRFDSLAEKYNTETDNQQQEEGENDADHNS